MTITFHYLTLNVLTGVSVPVFFVAYATSSVKMVCSKVLFPLIYTCNEYLLTLLYCGGGRHAFLCLLTEQ